MEIKNYLKYYLGCKCVIGSNDTQHTLHAVDSDSGSICTGENKHSIGLWWKSSACKPILRRIESLTEEEIYSLINIMFPDDIEERPSIDDYSFDSFYNDDSTMVDGDVAMGANYSCICYEGQIAITHDGTINMFGEDGEIQKMYNLPKAYNYLHSIGIWLYGQDAFIDGSVIDADTFK